MLIEIFNTHYTAYDVESTDNFNLVKISQLLDYYPLGLYQIGGRTFVPLRHFIAEA